MPEFKLPSWSARNPLGIIALFISLIYAMSAVLLGTSIKNLSSENQTILVYFIVGFPFIVLSVFGWLVSCHHTKLYGPGDYRTDRSFLEAGRTVTSADLGKRLEQELTLETEESPIDNGKMQLEKSDSPEGKLERVIFGTGTGRSSILSQAYLAEGLVFQALQAELGGSIRREVAIGGLHVDGLVYGADGATTVVEIKIISARSGNYMRRIREAKTFLDQAQTALKNQGIENCKSLLALLIDGNQGRLSEIKQTFARTGIDLDMRVYGLQELIDGYGFGNDTAPK